jgi:cytochrome b6
VSGVLLLFLMLGFGFSGYLLPWNELAFFATKVGTGIAGAVPVIGAPLMRFLRGGDDVTGATLSRFYALHVAILPAMTTMLLGLHLLFVQRQGMSVPIKVARRVKQGERIRQMPFFPDYIMRDVLVWYIAVALLAALAAFYPWELGRKADAFAPVPPGIRPEWYFLAMFHTLKLLPAHILVRGRSGRGRLRHRGGADAGGAVSRSPRVAGRNQPGVHRAWYLWTRLSRGPDDHRPLRILI